MTNITVALTDERLAKLRERAEAYGVSPEQLLQASIDNLIGGPDEEFKKAADHVLRKNAELYRRLA